METPAILFVCMGNICRSPLAEGALRAEAAARRIALRVDSAGTGGWHAGHAPDRRAVAVAARHGVDISGLRARKVKRDDFDRFDMVIALDRDNLADLARLRPEGARATLSLFLDHVPGRAGQSVADPYYGDDAGFDLTWRDVRAGAIGLLDTLG